MTNKDLIWVQMSDEDIKQAKELRNKKDKILGANYFDSNYRWIGELGEIAFERFAKEKSWDLFYGYESWKDTNVVITKDFYDCKLFGKIIDVKTNYVKYKPGCYVNGKELALNAYVIQDQFYKEGSINTYVFAKYWYSIYNNQTKHYIILVGWLPKETFGYLSETFIKGFEYPRDNVNFPKMYKNGIKNNMLDVLYYDLYPIIEINDYN